MKKLLTGVALTLAVSAFNSAAYASTDADAMMDKAAQLHSQAKDGGFVWKQKKMKQPYFDTYAAQYEEAKKKGDMKKAQTAAEFALKTAEGEVRQMTADVKAGWDK